MDQAVPAPRGHKPASPGEVGGFLAEFLLRGSDAAGARVLNECRVERLVQDADRRVLDPVADLDGATVTVRAARVAAGLPLEGRTYASGLSIGDATFFGRVAGRHAAGVPVQPPRSRGAHRLTAQFVESGPRQGLGRGSTRKATGTVQVEGPSDPTEPGDHARVTGTGWAPPASAAVTPAAHSGERRSRSGATPETTGGPAPPVPLRPMTAGDILDGAVTVMRTRPRVVLGVVAVLVIPYNVLVAYLQRDLLGGAGLDEIFSNPSLGVAAADSDANTGAALVSLVLGPLTLSLAGVAVGHLVAAWYSGGDPSTGDVLRRLGRRSGVALVAFLAVHVAELAGFIALFLPGLAVMALSVAASPIVGAEDAGPFASVTRSWRLAGRRFFPVLGLTLLTGLVVSFIGQVLLFLPTTVALAVGEDLGWLILAVGGSLVGIVTTALQAGTATLIYLDLRVRTEGLDLELAAADRFPPGP